MTGLVTDVDEVAGGAEVAGVATVLSAEGFRITTASFLLVAGVLMRGWSPIGFLTPEGLRSMTA